MTAVGKLLRELAEPWMRSGFAGEHVLRHPAAFFGAQLRTRGARPAAHQAETVADAEERGGRMRGDVVEETEQRRFPRRIFDDALAFFANAVVHTRIEMARTAGADVEAETSVRRLRDLQRTPHVIRDHA